MSTTTQEATAPLECRQFIGGEWVEGGSTFEDLDPFSGEVVANVPAGAREDAARAVEAAADAFPAWAKTLPAEATLRRKPRHDDSKSETIHLQGDPEGRLR